MAGSRPVSVRLVAGIHTLVWTGLCRLGRRFVLRWLVRSLVLAGTWSVVVRVLGCCWLTLGTETPITVTCRSLRCRWVMRSLRVRLLACLVTLAGLLVLTCTLKPGLVVSLLTR